jgi:hypothetical protein
MLLPLGLRGVVYTLGALELRRQATTACVRICSAISDKADVDLGAGGDARGRLPEARISHILRRFFIGTGCRSRRVAATAGERSIF